MDKYFAQLRKQPPDESGSTRNATGPEAKAAAPAEPASTATSTVDAEAKIPRGVVLGKDGKPCRTCTSSAAWRAIMKQPAPSTTPAAPATTSTAAATAATAGAQALAPADEDCPADVDTLGRHTWTLLHTLAATYPETPSAAQQRDVGGFVRLLGRVYPCGACAEDFDDWIRKEPVNASGRRGLGLWMCRAHNEVNRKLGKKEFDCGRWEERWRDGWKDGRCD